MVHVVDTIKGSYAVKSLRVESVVARSKYKKMPENSMVLLADAIEKGYSLTEIGQRLGGVTRQRVHGFLKDRGQHELWKEQRSKVINTISLVTEVVIPQQDALMNAQVSFVTLLSNCLEQKVGDLEQKVKEGIASATDIARAKAVRYWFAKRRAPLLKPLEVYVKTLEAYYHGLERSEKYSVVELSELRLKFSVCECFFKKSGRKTNVSKFSAAGDVG